MPPLIEEWWKGYIVLTTSVSPSASGVSNLRLSFHAGHACPLDTFLVLLLFAHFERSHFCAQILSKCNYRRYLVCATPSIGFC